MYQYASAATQAHKQRQGLHKIICKAYATILVYVHTAIVLTKVLHYNFNTSNTVIL
mgnify:CR=1 FL=1